MSGKKKTTNVLQVHEEINDVTRRGQKISVCYIIAKSDVHKAEMLVTLTLIDLILWKSPTWDICAHGTVSGFYSWVQLLEGWLALNPGLNLTRVSFPFSQKHFLGQFSLIFIEHQIINLLTKRTKLNLVYKLSYLNSNFALTLGYLNPALNNPALAFTD